MSETAGRIRQVAADGHTAQPDRAMATAVVHESYSFACMRCGHGWEQSYEIEHHLNRDGKEVVMYMADGRVVPSPLTRPTCHNCDGHELRIMRPGRVSSAQNCLHQSRRLVPQAAGEDVDAPRAEPKEPGGHHHWHLPDLLRPFRKAG